MKILYVHLNSLDFSKANMHQTMLMCNAFRRLDWNVTLAIPEINDYKMLQTRLAQLNEQYPNHSVHLRFYKKKWFQVILNYLGIKTKLISDLHDFDLIYSRDPSTLPRLIVAKCKIIFEAHNFRIFQKGGLIDDFWRKRLIGYSRRKNFYICCISYGLSNYFKTTGISSSKLMVHHDGYETQYFEEGYLKKGIEKLNYPFNKNNTYVTYAGSLYENRGIDQLIYVASRIKDLRFVVIGGPEQRKNELEQLALDNGVTNIDFLGQVKYDEVPFYLMSSDILVALYTSRVPTINYCSPLKLFEYMASGKPIVVNDFNTMREVLSDEDCYFVKPDSKEDLFQKITDAYQDINSDKPRGITNNEKVKKYSWSERVTNIISDFN